MRDDPQFISTIAAFLGWFYAAGAAMNLIAVVGALRGARPALPKAAAWALFGVGLAALALLAFLGRPPSMPAWAKGAIDACLGPVSVTLGSFVLLAILYVGREFFVRPTVAWTALNASLLLLGLSLTDPNFAANVSQPDNVPIVGMVFLLGFFLWLGASRAVENDRRRADALPPREKGLSDPVFVWPDLVYIELICMVLGMAVLIAWSLLLQAPLEQPANPVLTPNPAKAPWYFLGLQEMLVYFDASIAGVVFPLLIILGLMAIPYLDANPRGNGYYTIAERKFAYVVFQFGFLQLWILLILVGTFFRGPGWAFFGLYEAHDPHKVEVLSNIALSKYVWEIGLGVGPPLVDMEGGALGRALAILWRESVGVLLLAGYLLGLPILLGRTWLRDYRCAMGRGRYWIMTLLLLLMLILPIKMLLHWTTGLSYLVSMPEYSFHF